MNDIMFDIETLGTGPRALVLQIGACYFDRATGEIGNKILRNIRLDDSMVETRNNFTIGPQTVQWWLQQSKEAQESLFKNPEPISGRDACLDFNWFIKDGTFGWAHATFDFPILVNFFKQHRERFKLHFRNMRDIRTLIDLSGYNGRPKRDGIHHNALDDCIFQVKYCCEALKGLQ